MRTHSFSLLTIFIVLGAIVATTRTAAAVPTQVSFAGRLAGANGPMSGAVDLTFQLYDNTTKVWEEHHGTTATAGLVFVSLGSVEALDSSVFSGAALQLEIVIDGVPTTPRLPIHSVPYSMRSGHADDAEQLGGQPASAFARSDHRHDGAYLPLGTTLACGGTEKMTGIGPDGSVTCGTDAGSVYTATAGGGLSLAGNGFGIANAGVTTARIADGAVTTAKIGAGAITNAQIAQGAVDALQITANAVRSGEIQDGAIAAVDLAAGAVGTTALADNAVSRAKIEGTEVAIYQFDSSCEVSFAGLLVLAPGTCQTRVCPTGDYRRCGQSCSGQLISVPETCVTALRGYLLAP